MSDLLRLSIAVDGTLTGTINLWVLGFVLAVLVVFHRYLRRLYTYLFGEEYEIDQVELGIGSAKVKIQANHEVLQTAFKLWVELRTRKLGLPFEEDHDVIVEIYNSWYEFFRLTRDLVKTIPVRRIRDSKDTQLLVRISVDVLNLALRPHLTRWQARFRNWYEHESQKPENAGAEPQVLQKRFPDYGKLCMELKTTNARLVAYSNMLTGLLKIDPTKNK